MIDVIGVGACVLDTLIECDKMPIEDTKFEANSIKLCGGGPVSNALVAVSKLGKKANYLGIISNDKNGIFLLEDFKKYGVGIENIKLLEEARLFTSYIILSKENGTRTCVFNRGSLTDKLDCIDYNAIKQAKILHLDGNYLNMALESAKIARKNGVLVSLDAGGLYCEIEKLLPYVDILIPSEEFAIKYSGKHTAEEAMVYLKERYNPKILVITQGSSGGIYFDDRIKRYKNFKVEVKDSNGAGDIFHGAFLVAYLENKNINECCEFASATAALKCAKIGARENIPKYAKVMEYIKNN